MTDLMSMDLKRLAKFLLLGADDEYEPDKVPRWLNGRIEEIDETHREEGRIDAFVSYSEIASDENECFGHGEVVANASVERGEHDAYASNIVVVFDDMSDMHSVMLSGGHTSAGNSDESHEGHFNGTLTIITKDRRDEEIAKLVAEHRMTVMQDVSSRISTIISDLHGYSFDEIKKGGITGKIALLNRMISGAD